MMRTLTSQTRNLLMLAGGMALIMLCYIIWDSGGPYLFSPIGIGADYKLQFRTKFSDFSEEWESEYYRQLRDTRDYLSLLRDRNLTFTPLTRRTTPARSHMTSRKEVPNVSHYINLGKNRKLGFIQYMSYYSTFKIQKPDYVFLHGDHTYVGPLWEKLLRQKIVRNFFFVKWDWPSTHLVYNTKPYYIQHQSDFLRMLIIRDLGGQYIDDDIIVTSSFRYYRRRYNCTVGQDTPERPQLAVIVCRRGTPFLRLMAENFRTYSSVWIGNNNLAAQRIKAAFPHVVHVSKYISGPRFSDRLTLNDDDWTYWQKYYSVHVYHRSADSRTYIPTDFRSVAHFRSAVGLAMRLSLYGRLHAQTVTSQAPPPRPTELED